MAWSKVVTEVQNPAGKRSSMTAKQIKYFGTKRQKSALRSKRKKSSGRKKAHRARTRPNPPRKKKRAVARHTPAPKKRRKKSSAKKSKRRNPVPQIVSWVATGNPARKRGKKAMAKPRKKRAVARHTNAGRRRKSTTRRHHRRNPGGLGRPMDWVQGGAGVLAGVLGTRALPQMILGASNTGPMGYAANAVAALALGWGAHMLFKKPVITTAVVAGGFASLFSRIIADKTPYGAQFSLSGLGDWGLGLYQKSNFPYPPRLQNGRGPGSSMFTWGDGSQGQPAATYAAGGSDSTGAC
jgi:hypothetical protein